MSDENRKNWLVLSLAMFVLLLAIIVLCGGGCEPPDPPDAEQCTRFSLPTRLRARAVVCQMVWCVQPVIGGTRSGLASLGCEPPDGGQ